MNLKKLIEKFVSNSHHSTSDRSNQIDSHQNLSAQNSKSNENHVSSILELTNSSSSIHRLTDRWLSLEPSKSPISELNNDNSQELQQSSYKKISNNKLSTNFNNDNDENEIAHLGSSCCCSNHFNNPSYCCENNKVEHDLDDLNIHHDHNTKLIYKNTNHLKKIFDNLNQLRKEKKLCDLKLVVDNKEIVCHRAILIANSSYFLAMFSSGLVETIQAQIELKEIDFESLESIVNYMYTGELIITEDNVLSILTTANILNMISIKESCGQFIQSHLDVDNCLGIREFADSHSCNVLLKHAETFIEQYFSEIVLKDEFLMLDLDQVIRLISKDHLMVDSELIVYESVVRWLNHDFLKRTQHMFELMKNVRFGLMDYDDLLKISNDKFLRKNQESFGLVQKAINYKLNNTNEKENLHVNICPNFYSPRKPFSFPKMLFLMGGQSPKAISKIDIYDFRSQTWIENAKEMPSKRCRGGAVYYNGLIYLIGGFNGQTRLASVDIYNPVTNEWTKGPDMNCKRGTIGVGLINHNLYAVGGFDGTSGLTLVERLNLKQMDQWRIMSSLSIRRSSVCVVVLNNYLYAIGGYCGLSRECLDSVERFDELKNEWSSIPNMLKRRSGACSIVYDGKIFVAGGHDGPTVHKSVEVYDPMYNEWKFIAELNTVRRNAGFIVYNGLFYIIGGDEGQSNLSSVEIYNPQRDVWSLLPTFLHDAKSYTNCLLVDSF